MVSCISALIARDDPRAIRVMIVDDHLMTVETLEAFLASEPGIDVVATASDGSTALQQVVECRPDVLLLDMNMPGMDGLEVVRRIRACAPEVAILVVTGYCSRRPNEALMRVGACGYLDKSRPLSDLVTAVRGAARGESQFFPYGSTGDAINTVPELTPRQHEILDLVARGLTNRQIAVALSIAEPTVSIHVGSLLQRLGASSRTEACYIAKQVGLL
jgi:DNA-binding NarL/FixJ family response regulator